MTDKEKAEEYLKNNHCNDCMFWDCCYGVENKECVEKTKYIKNHLDGLAEGKPKWHDLRKNPDDLPTETRHYLTDDGEYVYDAFHRKWRTIACETCWDLHWLDDGDVIAWCELPKFER